MSDIRSYKYIVVLSPFHSLVMFKDLTEMPNVDKYETSLLLRFYAPVNIGTYLFIETEEKVSMSNQEYYMIYYDNHFSNGLFKKAYVEKSKEVTFDGIKRLVKDDFASILNQINMQSGFEAVVRLLENNGIVFQPVLPITFVEESMKKTNNFLQRQKDYVEKLFKY